MYVTYNNPAHESPLAGGESWDGHSLGDAIGVTPSDLHAHNGLVLTHSHIIASLDSGGDPTITSYTQPIDAFSSGTDPAQDEPSVKSLNLAGQPVPPISIGTGGTIHRSRLANTSAAPWRCSTDAIRHRHVCSTAAEVPVVEQSRVRLASSFFRAEFIETALVVREAYRSRFGVAEQRYCRYLRPFV